MEISFPFSQSRILAASAVAVSHTGDANETILATIAIPAGIMGLNGILRVTSFWTVTASVNNKTLRHRLGGIAGTIFGTVGPTTNAAVTVPHMISQIANRNAVNAQLGYTLRNRVTDLLTQGELTTGTVNTAAAQDLVFTGLLATTTETITLEGYLVELLAP